MQRRIALVDVNNFYVSCERVFRPDLEGKPIVSCVPTLGGVAQNLRNVVHAIGKRKNLCPRACERVFTA